MIRQASLIALMCAIATFAPTSLAAAAGGTGLDKGELSILTGPEPLKVKASEDDDTATATLSLLNPGVKPVPYRIFLEASSSGRVRLERPVRGVVIGNSAALAELTFTGLEGIDEAATGQLVIKSAGAPLAQGIELDPAPQPPLPWPATLIIASFFISLILMALVVPPKSRRNIPAPGPKLSFESVATVLTAAGGIFATVMGAVTFPTMPEQIAEQSVVSLAAIFAALVVLAPFVFEALRKTTVSPVDERNGRIGTNGTVLIACMITMWGVLGEIGLLGLLGWELTDASGRVFVIGAIVMILVLAIRYFLVSVSKLVRRDWPREEEEKKLAEVAEEPPEEPLSREEEALPFADTYSLRDLDLLRVARHTALPTFSVDTVARSAEISVPPVVAIAPTPAKPERWSLL
jgi:Na+-transporting methylmalonyl-CoA/oxaloacetate decarboxylase gamma subunit